MRSTLFLLPALMTGCASTAQFEELSDKFDALEKRIVDLEARPAGGGQGGMSSADEAKAGDLAREMIDGYRSGDFKKAQASWAEMRSKYAGSKAYRDRSA